MAKRFIDILFGLGLLSILAVVAAYFVFVRPRSDGLMLKDFEPVPILVVNETPVERAKFPVFDAHIHLEYSGMTADEVVATMKQANVYRIAALETHGLYGEQLAANIARYESKYPDKILTVCNLDFTDIDAEDYSGRAVARLDEAFKLGARALKVWRDLGLQVRDGKSQLLTLDDPRFDGVWRRAGELGMPIIMHNADPTAFWKVVDPHNERYEELQARQSESNYRWGKYGPLFDALTGRFFKASLMRHPERLFYNSAFNWEGSYYPAKDEILAARRRIMSRHPDTQFIGAHMGYSADNLDYLARELDAHPNYIAEMSHVVPELGRQPFTTREFFMKYQDRILFGLDGKPEADAYAASFRFLETYDEYIEFPRYDWHKFGRWRIYGIGLPDPVLKKIYSRNAERVFTPVVN